MSGWRKSRTDILEKPAVHIAREAKCYQGLMIFEQDIRPSPRSGPIGISLYSQRTFLHSVERSSGGDAALVMNGKQQQQSDVAAAAVPIAAVSEYWLDSMILLLPIRSWPRNGQKRMKYCSHAISMPKAERPCGGTVRFVVMNGRQLSIRG